MSKREASVLLDDIRTSIKKIQRYTAGLDEGSFLADEKTIDAVVCNLEIIGEAAKQLPAEFKNRHSAIPWTQIAVLRNRTDKGTMGKGIDPKEGATHSSRVGLQNLPHVPSTK